MASKREGRDIYDGMTNGESCLHICSSEAQGGSGERRKMVFKINDEKQVGFIGYFLYGGFMRMLWWLLLLQFFFYIVITCQQFRELYAQEKMNIEDASARYELTCLSNDAKRARLFHSSCTKDRVDRDKNALWEAFVRLARKQRICGENDCSGAFYVFVGAILGALTLLFLLPKLGNLLTFGIDRLNASHYMNYGGETEVKYGDVWNKKT